MMVEPFTKVDNALGHAQKAREVEVIATGDAPAPGRVAEALEKHQAMLERLATLVDELERAVQPALASAFPPDPAEIQPLEPGSELTSCVTTMTQVARNIADRLSDIIARVEL